MVTLLKKNDWCWAFWSLFRSEGSNSEWFNFAVVTLVSEVLNKRSISAHLFNPSVRKNLATVFEWTGHIDDEYIFINYVCDDNIWAHIMTRIWKSLVDENASYDFAQVCVAVISYVWQTTYSTSFRTVRSLADVTVDDTQFRRALVRNRQSTNIAKPPLW